MNSFAAEPVSSTKDTTEPPLYGVTTESPIDFGVSTYGTSKPTKIWNLSTQGYYSFSGWNFGDPLYSEYKFTGVSRVKITCKNTYSSKLTVKLLKEQFGVDFSVSTQTLKANSYLEWHATVEPTRFYILRFSCPASFSGTITGA